MCFFSFWILADSLLVYLFEMTVFQVIYFFSPQLNLLKVLSIYIFLDYSNPFVWFIWVFCVWLEFLFAFLSNLQVYHLFLVHNFALYIRHTSFVYPSALIEPTFDFRLFFPHQFFLIWWHFYTNVICKIEAFIGGSAGWLKFISSLFILLFFCTKLFSTYVIQIMFLTLVYVFLWSMIAFSSFLKADSFAVDDSFLPIFVTKSSRA
jgi:hypothetical protein